MDLSNTIQPKSDQLNADDFIATGPITVTITDVKAGTDPNQPVSIFFKNDNGKPYKPGKSMRRVLVSVWGKDAKAYIGQSMTLYREPEVMYSGIKVGGIRISHMSNIEQPITLALTASKTSRKPFTVQPLAKVAKIDLNPSYKGWEKAKAALKAGETTIEKIRESFELSEENEALIKAEEGAK
jgi:hypothetical protein